MRKKFFIIVAVILAALMCLTACTAGQQAADIPTANNELSEAQAFVEEQTAKLEEATEALLEDAGAIREELQSQSDETVFSRGSNDGKVYTSEFSGMTFTAPDGFVFFNEEEMIKVFNLSSDYFDIEATDTVVYEMYCANQEKGSSVNIIFENMEGVYGSIISEEEYLELSMQNLKDTFTPETGLAIDSIEISPVTVSGNDINCINAVLDMSGTPFYQIQTAKKAGDYMMVVTSGALSEDELAEIISGISFK